MNRQKNAPIPLRHAIPMPKVEEGDTSEDYRNASGILCCGKCHTPKEAIMNTGALKGRHMPCVCDCKAQDYATEQARLEAEELARRRDRLRSAGITDASYLKHTFANDDGRNPEILEICRGYVETWPIMKAKNSGILFYGQVGTGKSFFACAIANALIDKGVRACVTNFPRILNTLQGVNNRQEYLDSLNKYDLLVIDDLGVERDTSYSVEQLFAVIDARSRADKPLIVTSNLSPETMLNPANVAYARIYDRVLEMCSIRLRLAGASRRLEASEKRGKEALEILSAARRRACNENR